MAVVTKKNVFAQIRQSLYNLISTLDKALGDEILGRLGKNMTIPLAVIR